MVSHSTTGRDDATRPPLFTAEEWRTIVASLMLSPRQAAVVGLVMQSRKDKEIARLLGIQETTVYTHINKAKERIGASDRVGLAYRVFETFRHVTERSRTPRK